MPESDPGVPQDTVRADSRLVGLKIVFPPVGNANPSGFDVLIRNVPNMPKLGALVGRTTHYLDRAKSTYLTCRLPRAVTSYYLEDPYISPLELVIQQRIALTTGEPSTNDYPPLILELHFAEQPVETLVL